MIQSKRSFGLGVLFLDILFILIPILFILLIVPSSTAKAFMHSALLVSILLIFIVVLIKSMLNKLTQVGIDQTNKSIVFKSLFPQKERTFFFSDLDGYITGRIRLLSSGNNRQLIKVVAIVQEKKIVGYFSEIFIENVNELEEGIKQLPYLGYHSISLWARWKLFFGLLRIS